MRLRWHPLVAIEKGSPLLLTVRGLDIIWLIRWRLLWCAHDAFKEVLGQLEECLALRNFFVIISVDW